MEFLSCIALFIFYIIQMANRNCPRKESFNLEKFYNGLSRVESSLGKGQCRKTAQSPVTKDHTHNREDRSKYLDNFKKNLISKQISKVKIRLEGTADRLKMSNAVSQQYSHEIKKNRNSQIASETESLEIFEKTSSKVIGWDKQEKENVGQLAFTKTKVKGQFNTQQKLQDNTQSLKDTVSKQFYQSRLDQPANPVQIQTYSESLISQLTKRQNIYRKVQSKLNNSIISKYQPQLSLKLEHNFREHQVMKKVIDEFKRICGLQISSMSQLYKFLTQNTSKDPTQRSNEEFVHLKKNQI